MEIQSPQPVATPLSRGVALMISTLGLALGCADADPTEPETVPSAATYPPSVSQTCELPDECASGVCVPGLCPRVNPGLSYCGLERQEGQVGCAPDAICVSALTGKYRASCSESDPETICVPRSVCGEDLIASGSRCERDWECESEECIGVLCETPPDAFAFGQVRVCVASRCSGTTSAVASALGECAGTTPCAGPGPSYVPCIAAGCPEAYASCEASPECEQLLTCVEACGEESFWDCLNDCLITPCEEGEERRIAPDSGNCYCVAANSCGG